MNFQQLDRIADSVFPLYALALLICALAVQKGASWLFILRTVVAVVLAQQISKQVQKLHFFDHATTTFQAAHRIHAQFPSTHFATVLCIATAFCLFGKRFVWAGVAVPVLYGVLVLYQTYHTPLELLGALYAIPLTYLVHLIGPRPHRVAANSVLDPN